MYWKYGLDSSGDSTDEFMEKLCDDDEIKAIVFLVPDEMFSFREKHPDSPADNITVREFKYLLDHPEAAKKVYLVFGANNMVRKSKILGSGAVDNYGTVIDGERYSTVERKLVRGFEDLVKVMKGEG